MRIIILCLAFVFLPQIYAYSASVDAPPVEKREKVKKKVIKSKLDKGKGMKTSTLFSVIGLILIVPAAIFGIYGAIAGISTLYILGLVLGLIALIFALIGLILYYSEKKKDASMGEEEKKEEDKKSGMD